jgi:nitrogen fixation NifU-like protein
MNLYSNKTIKHFLNPENTGEIEDADSVGESGNPDNGNYMKIWIKVSEGRIIEEIKFKTVGCVPAIASGSVVTTLAKGKTVEEASRLSSRDILNQMGSLPAEKIHTVKLAANALKDALCKLESG